MGGEEQISYETLSMESLPVKRETSFHAESAYKTKNFFLLSVRIYDIL
jgi:hypothetical protein